MRFEKRSASVWVQRGVSRRGFARDVSVVRTRRAAKRLVANRANGPIKGLWPPQSSPAKSSEVALHKYRAERPRRSRRATRRTQREKLLLLVLADGAGSAGHTLKGMFGGRAPKDGNPGLPTTCNGLRHEACPDRAYVPTAKRTGIGSFGEVGSRRKLKRRTASSDRRSSQGESATEREQTGAERSGEAKRNASGVRPNAGGKAALDQSDDGSSVGTRQNVVDV